MLTVLYGFIIVILSALIFTSLSKLLDPMESLVWPHSKLNGAKSWWNTKNTAISLAHSFASGVISIWCLTTDINLLREPFTHFSRLGYFSVCLSEGYFLYDALDVYSHRHEYKHTKEILIHHTLILINLGLSVVECKYIGVCTIGLVTENHNILLHLRSLLRDAGVPTLSTVFRIVAWGNIIAVVAFRLLPYSYLLYHNILVVKSGIYPYPRFHYFFFWTLLFLIFSYTFVLFRRFILADFCKQPELIQTPSALKIVKDKASKTEFQPINLHPTLEESKPKDEESKPKDEESKPKDDESKSIEVVKLKGD